MNEELMEPLKYYNNVGRARHDENVKEYLNGLISRSGVDIAANHATVKKYHAEEALAKKISKRITFYKIFRVLLIIAAIIGGIIALVAAISSSESSIAWMIVGLLVIPIALVIIFKVVNPRIKDSSALRDKHLQKAEKYISEAYEQMRPLNELFDDTDTAMLIEKTIPELQLEPRFECSRERLLREEYDFYDLLGEKDSTVDILSGSFSGNPFVFLQSRAFEMGAHTYHGTLTIRWTETYRDSDGRMRTRTKTQTLHASLTKPEPQYRRETVLFYGSQAAPALSFSRTPQHSEALSEKELEKKIRKGEKKLHKHAEEMTEKGKDFSAMANSEFEVLFGAQNRDHEVEFRVMYTPLAQRNTVDLLTGTGGYGDDFHFRKQKRLNIITSEHGRSWRMDTGTSNYRSYDIELIKSNFINFNNEYFKSVFFDLAPLIAIPAYAESPESSYAEKPVGERCFGDYEHEVMANRVGGKLIPDGCATEVIYKTHHKLSKDGADHVGVLAWGYVAIPRLDFVPVLGGDGKIHGVPVNWIEYDYVEKASELIVRAADYSEREYRLCGESADKVFFHRMTAEIVNEK
jgi:hypothetical protein